MIINNQILSLIPSPHHSNQLYFEITITAYSFILIGQLFFLFLFAPCLERKKSRLAFSFFSIFFFKLLTSADTQSDFRAQKSNWIQNNNLRRLMQATATAKLKRRIKSRVRLTIVAFVFVKTTSASQIFTLYLLKWMTFIKMKYLLSP